MATRKPYPSDVSNEEWEFVAPYLALVREDAPQRDHDLREVFNGLRWVGFAPAHRGATCHTTCLRGKPSINRPSGGYGRECSRRWSTICAYSCGFRRAGRPTRRPRYSTRAPCARLPRVVPGAATMEPNARRRARRYIQRQTPWGTCST